MRMVLLGPPGAGKGTQAKLLSTALKVPHISTGDIFRANIKDDTELGKQVKHILDEGKLVPDEITVKIVEDRIAKDDCTDGFILDGFPRTINQAEMLDQHLGANALVLDVVINMEIPDDAIVERMAGRRMCSNCGRSYHIKRNPPKVDGICDFCSSKLYVRDDDREETVRQRLKTYHEQTSPLIAFYEKKGLCIDIDAQKGIDQTLEEILATLPAK